MVAPILFTLLAQGATNWPVAAKPSYVAAPGDPKLAHAQTLAAPKKGTGSSLVMLVKVWPSTNQIVKLGSLAIGVKEGRIVPQPTPPTGWLKLSADPNVPHVVTVVSRDKDYAVYFDGDLFTSLPGGKPLTPSVPADMRQSPLVSIAKYGRRLTLAEIRANAKAAPTYVDSLTPDTPTVTVDATLTTTTEVPDPARIKPYRNALLAQDYKIVSFVSGHAKGLKIGGKLRVFRYGIYDGKKTDIQNEKPGDKVRITVQTLDSNPTMSREYQLDNLDTDVTATYYVEVPNDRPAGGSSLLALRQSARGAALPANRPAPLR